MYAAEPRGFLRRRHIRLLRRAFENINIIQRKIRKTLLSSGDENIPATRGKTKIRMIAV